MWACLVHTRPASFVPLFLGALSGYALAGPATGLVLLGDLTFLFALYGVLLWGGTNAWNSACDGDVGALNLLPDPPAIPRHLGLFGATLKLAAIALAATRGWELASLVALCVALSFVYSTRTPWWPRGKDVPGVDMAINALGLGLLAFLIGGGVAGTPWSSELVVAGLAFSLAYLGGVPTTQIHQLTPESRDWTATLGPSRVLVLGAALFVAHAAWLLSIGLPWAGWPAALSAAWLLLTGLAAAHLIGWSRSPHTRAVPRMRRQLGLAMGAQLAWTAAMWG